MIELTDWLQRELAHRADVEAPNECCGLISRATAATPGHNDSAIALWAAENVAPDPTSSFAIDPIALIGIIKQISGRNENLVGVYHSHPKGTAAPSTEDITIAANWPGLTWIIVGKIECGDCEGGGQILSPDRLGDPCEACEGSGEVPAFWAGVLA